MASNSVTAPPTRADVARYEADVEHLAECIYRREQADLGPSWESAFPSAQEAFRQRARAMLALLRSSGFNVVRRERAEAPEAVAQPANTRLTDALRRVGADLPRQNATSR
jgi:hypothetical protein